MTLSVGAATDYLYALAQQAVAGVTVNGQSAIAVDGEPDELAFGMFVVGQATAPPEVSGEIVVDRGWADRGGRWVDDDYAIPCYIDVRVAGDQTKVARDLVEQVFNTFWADLAADFSLGGLLDQSHPAEVVNLRFVPINVGSEGQPGRRYVAHFSVHCATTTK